MNINLLQHYRYNKRTKLEKFSYISRGLFGLFTKRYTVDLPQGKSQLSQEVYAVKCWMQDRKVKGFGRYQDAEETRNSHVRNEVVVFSQSQKNEQQDLENDLQEIVSARIYKEQETIPLRKRLSENTEIYTFKNRSKQGKKKTSSWGRRIIIGLLGIVFALSLIFTSVIFLPNVWYTTADIELETVEPQEKASVLGGDYALGPDGEKEDLPEANENLPDGNWLMIPKIGVITQIQESDNEKEALNNGVWRVPQFGTPIENENPIIMAAHRYGFVWWTQEFRKQNSFYNLPQLEPGDTFEIIWDKRKFTYEVYKAEETTEITDYDAHVILYTCKFLVGDIRHVRYARRIDYELIGE